MPGPPSLPTRGLSALGISIRGHAKGGSLCSRALPGALRLAVGLWVIGTGLGIVVSSSGCRTPGESRASHGPSTVTPTDTPPPTGLFEDIAVPPPSRLESALDSSTWDESQLPSSIHSASERGRSVEVIRDDRPDSKPERVRVERSVEHGLGDRMRELLKELERFEGQPEGNLDDGERLTKHKLVSQLINLHFLLPGREIEYLDPLLDALESPLFPGTVHTLLQAAFYHDVGREDLRERILSELRGPEAAPELALEHLKLCSRVDGFRAYTPFLKSSFGPDDRVFVYGELMHLESVRSGEMWRRGVSINVYLYDSAGREADRRLLTPPGGAWESTPIQLEQNHFCSPYRFPLRVEAGEYRLLVQVTDLNSDVSASDELMVTIVR